MKHSTLWVPPVTLVGLVVLSVVVVGVVLRVVEVVKVVGLLLAILLLVVLLVHGVRPQPLLSLLGPGHSPAPARLLTLTCRPPSQDLLQELQEPHVDQEHGAGEEGDLLGFWRNFLDSNSPRSLSTSLSTSPSSSPS